MAGIFRPDQLAESGIRAIGDFSKRFYQSEKKRAKARAELAYFGEKKAEKVVTQWYAYNTALCELVNDKFDLRAEDLVKDHYHWINYHGLHEVDKVEQISTGFNLDRLTIRRVLDTTQRPKVESYDHYIHFSVKSIVPDEEENLETEQISFILGDHYVITFQEAVNDTFGDIRQKMRDDIGFIRKRSADYLLTQLLDAILDYYFMEMEKLTQATTEVELQLAENPEKEVLISLENYRKNAQLIKKSLVPLKEVLQSREILESPLFHKSNRRFIADLHNITTSALEEIDALMKALESLTNIYFASQSQKMNEIMKMLTLVATIFIPLTFIAGIYGMNFNYMPELAYRMGYPLVLFFMLLVAIGMLFYFRRKGWFK